jgi:hypothetical protein
MRLSLATLVTLLFATGEVYSHGHERSMHPREIAHRQVSASLVHLNGCWIVADPLYLGSWLPTSVTSKPATAPLNSQSTIGSARWPSVISSRNVTQRSLIPVPLSNPRKPASETPLVSPVSASLGVALYSLFANQLPLLFSSRGY